MPKLTKFKNQNEKKISTKNLFVAFGIILLIMGGVIISKTYAIYKLEKKYDVIKAQIGEFDTEDIILSYTFDGETRDINFPNKEDGYLVNSVTCENGTTASWDNNTWSLTNIIPGNSRKIRCNIDFKNREIYKIYAVRRNINSTSSAWERIEDAQGLVANAQIGEETVQNDFDSIYPWNEIISYNYDTTSNKITAYYGEENFKFDGSNGEVLTKIPEFYYKREQKEGYEYIYITKGYKEGYTKSEEFSVGRYTVSGTGENDIHSRSGFQPLTSKTITEFRDYARSMGNGFGQMDYHYFILQLLYLVEYADYYSQAKLGLGISDSSNIAPAKSGGCNALGMKSGTLNNDGKHSMIYRGIEDIYGNIYQFADGINIKDNQAYICYNQNEYESDKTTECYQRLGYKNATATGYVSKLGYDSSHPLIPFPTEMLGTETTYTHIYYATAAGNRVVRVGGSWSHTNRCGLWQIHSIVASTDFNVASARLIKTN